MSRLQIHIENQQKHGNSERKFNKYSAEREGEGPIHGVIGIINVPGSAFKLLPRARNEPQKHLVPGEFADNSPELAINRDSETGAQPDSSPTASIYPIYSPAPTSAFPYDMATTSTNIGYPYPLIPQQREDQHLQRGAPAVGHQTTMGIDLQSNHNLMIHHVAQNMKYLRQHPGGTVVLHQSQWHRHSHNTWSHHHIDNYHLLQCFECGFKLRLDVDQQFEHYRFKNYYASKGQGPIHGVIGIVNVQRAERKKTTY